MNTNLRETYLKVLNGKLDTKRKLAEDLTLGYYDGSGNWVNSDGDVEQNPNNSPLLHSWQQQYQLANFRSPMFVPKLGGPIADDNPVSRPGVGKGGADYVDIRWRQRVEFHGTSPPFQFPPNSKYQWVEHPPGRWTIHFNGPGPLFGGELSWYDVCWPEYPPDMPPLRLPGLGTIPNTFPAGRWGEIPDIPGTDPMHRNLFNRANWPLLFGDGTNPGLIRSLGQLLQLLHNFGVNDFGWVRLPNDPDNPVIDWPYDGVLRNFRFGDTTGGLSTGHQVRYGDKILRFIRENMPEVLELLMSPANRYHFLEGNNSVEELFRQYFRDVKSPIPNILTPGRDGQFFRINPSPQRGPLFLETANTFEHKIPLKEYLKQKIKQNLVERNDVNPILPGVIRPKPRAGDGYVPVYRYPSIPPTTNNPAGENWTRPQHRIPGLYVPPANSPNQMWGRKIYSSGSYGDPPPPPGRGPEWNIPPDPMKPPLIIF